MNQNQLPEYQLVRSQIKNVYIQIKDGHVIVKAPKLFPQNQIDEMVMRKAKWIEKGIQKTKQKQEKEKRYSEEEFIKIIEENAKDLIYMTGLKPNRIRVKKIKYAWGSCSPNKNITLNYELIKYSKQAIRYVILHELCHLKHMNHSKEFWDLVILYMPQYKEAKKEFK